MSPTQPAPLGTDRSRNAMRAASIQRGSTAIGRALLLLAIISIASCNRGQPTAPLPDQRQPSERHAQIAALDLQRTGTLRVELRSLRSVPASDTDEGRVRFRLQSPISRVEDTEIRGSLDGRTKYDFNQGNAYHMRVGRRTDGQRHGEFELKRSLLRWELPELPAGTRVAGAEVSVWVEGFSIGSPLAEESPPLPLHVYAYALDDDWGPGEGGVERNSFSNAAPGEANWNQARVGERSWPVPGALEPGASPLAIALLEGDERWLTFRSDALRRFVEHCVEERRSFDLLLKLADDEEDQWGTETALLSSDFGDERDIASHRPRLVLDAQLGAPAVLLDEEFVLEPGEERVYSVALPAGEPALLSAQVTPEARDGVVPPAIFVRDPTAGPGAAESSWLPLRAPLRVSWKAAEVRLSSAPSPLPLGETFRVKLRETWVRPGPRDEQLPELLLLAPSGLAHRVDGHPIDEIHHGIDFAPDEPGLWRYGWSFIPRAQSPPGSHQGEGLFYVFVPTDDGELLQAWANEIAAAAAAREASDRSLQYRLNALVRRAARYGQSSEQRKAAAQQILDTARDQLPAQFQRDAD